MKVAMVPTITEVERQAVVMVGAMLREMATGKTDLPFKGLALRMSLGAVQAVMAQAVDVPMGQQAALATNSLTHMMLLASSSSPMVTLP